MKRSIETALAFLALAGAVAPAAATDQGSRGEGSSARFERADADNSGDVSLDEFTAAMSRRVRSADANADGKMTVAEIAAEIARQRGQRIAERMVRRLDTDGDGALTAAEIEAGQKMRFARLDGNGDGKLTADELPRRGARTPKNGAAQ